MKTIGYLALAVLTISTISCGNKGGGDNGQPVNPALLNINGVRPVQNNINSLDIVEGKIVNRNFQTLRGHGSETVNSDSCDESLAGNHNDNLMFSRMGGQIGFPGQINQPNISGPASNNLELNFDASGILTVTLHLLSGDLRSNAISPSTNQSVVGSSTYYLDDSSQTIVVSPFTVQGAPRSEYIQRILSSRGILRRNAQGQVGSMMDQDGMFGNMNGGAGFVANYKPGQVITPQANQAVNANNIVFAEFSEGLQLKIETTGRINPQHVLDMKGNGIRLQTESVVTDLNGRGACRTQTALNVSGISLQ